MYDKKTQSSRCSHKVSLIALFGIASFALWSTNTVVSAQVPKGDHGAAKMEYQISLVPFIKVPEPVLMDRLTGRWTCKENGHIFHTMFNPPAQPGICDIDGSELYQRPDDSSETVANRVKVYFDQTAPLIDYYKEKSVLTEIDGNQEIENVNKALLDILPTVD